MNKNEISPDESNQTSFKLGSNLTAEEMSLMNKIILGAIIVIILLSMTLWFLSTIS